MKRLKGQTPTKDRIRKMISQLSARPHSLRSGVSLMHVVRNKEKRQKAMNVDAAIDSFVVRFNAANKDTLLPEDLPEHLREGEPDEFGQYRWSIKKANCSRWVSDLMYKLPKRLPASFQSLISRYAFPAFQLGPVFLFGNTGEEIQWELKDKIIRDELIANHLMRGGFLQFGNPYEYNYDPICFDTRQGGEDRVVQLDHEEILCNSRIKIVKEIAPSFLDLVKMS